ncbi:hypothetical protein TSAR_016237 [Trichomalopsis sarcophagae]|uniref:ABC transporter domain-containing protein n=1 Tax=Trichomalopsis sarcophagae TaxID=543379 RepID=A0A232FG80_9HYME|nr:hypothetical protein TSAR_016237 [Trichomalopsis sarcophagae]
MTIDNTSFFSYIYSSWLTKYLWKAYRKGITLDEVPDISALDSSSCNIQKFENLWNEELRHRGPTSASLPLVAWRFVRFRVLTSCILNAASQIISFILQTIFLRKLLEYSEGSESYFFNGMHWVIYIVAFDLLQMTLSTWSDIMNQRTALRLKSACLSLLFKKVVNLNSVTHKNTDELLSMLSRDGHKIYEAVKYGTSIVNGPVVTVCALICISLWLSPSALLGIVIFLSFYVIQYWLVHLIDYCKSSANEFTRIRIKKTVSALKSIRLIKINGWEQHFVQNITNVRSRESKWLWKLSYVNSLNSSIAHAIPIIAIIAIFFMHFSMTRDLTASVAFPICVVVIVQMQSVFMSMKSSLSRLRDSLITFNKIKGGLLLEDTSCHVSKPYEASQAVAIVNGTFVHDKFKKQNYDSENAEDEKKNNFASIDSVTEPEKEKLTDQPTFQPKRIEILSSITFKAKKGQLIGICGRANSGKSSLLLAALGQIKMTNGQLMRQGSCAYVGQKAWLSNTTIRENILFEEAYDAKRYYEAQVVCKLRQDIKRLPDGDETEIGETGVEIPEALRQKIALARAFYADRDIYFLDDPLSSMENSVAQEIFEDLIIRALGEKTILFVTHDLEYLDRCDYMYIMRDRRIAEHGRHKELMRLGREYAAMVRTAIDAEGDYANEFSDSQDDNSEKETEDLKAKENRKASLNNGVNTDNESRKSNSSFIDGDEDNVEPREITAMTYYTYVKSLGGFVLLFPIILVYVIYASIGVLSLLRLTWWIEAINDTEKENSFSFYKNWYGSCFFLVVLGCVVQSFVVQFATTRIADNIHYNLLNKILNAPIKFFDAASTGRIKNLLLQDLDNVSLSLPSKLDNTLRYMVVGFMAFFVLMSTIPWFTNYVVFCSILFFFVGKIYRASQKNLIRLENMVRLATKNFLQNSIQGLSTIRTFKKENDLLSKFQDLMDHNSACIFIKGVSEKWLSIRLQILTTTCIFVAASSIVTMKGEISPAIAGLTFVFILQVPNIIEMNIRYFSKTEIGFVSVKNICDYLQALVHERDDKPASLNPDLEWPATGSIDFEKVHMTLGYDARFMLSNATFSIMDSEKIGLLARKELDKSAFVEAIYRLNELAEGKISIDNVDISKIDLKLLRNRISIIPKTPVFYGTVRFFLDPTKLHSDADIWHALERVHLKDKISAVASQLHYTIDRKIFSTSEKQRLFLAKAFLCQNKILLIEEIVNPDFEASGLVNQVIEKEFSNSTVVTITSRTRTALSCDRVLVIDSGRVLEFDTPSMLMADQHSNLRKIIEEEDAAKKRRTSIQKL